MILALPIPPGKLEAWRRLCQELAQGRRGQQSALREDLGVRALRGWLLHTSNSGLGLLQMETDDPDRVVSNLSVSDHPFVRWLRRELKEINALDLKEPASATDKELLFEWGTT